jgi:hypothetical protein
MTKSRERIGQED